MPEYLLKQQGKSCSDGAFSVRCQWKCECKPTVLLLDLLNANITKSLELCAFALSLGRQQKIILFYHHSLTEHNSTLKIAFLKWFRTHWFIIVQKNQNIYFQSHSKVKGWQRICRKMTIIYCLFGVMAIIFIIFI